MNKKAKITLSVLIGFVLLIGIFILVPFLSGSGEMAIQKSITEKEFYAEKYQKIQTDYVNFELPYYATHYWTDSSGDNDRYEVIISNFSIKDNDDYVLRLTWYDERYISETLQVHYEFKDGRLRAEDIKFYSLSKYQKSCIDNVDSSLSATPYRNCEKAKDDSKLRFITPKIEIGHLVGYEYQLENNGTDEFNVSSPVYSWQPYSDISITKIDSDFIAIDDVGVSACGVLSTPGETYVITSNPAPVSRTCMDISGDGITLDCNNKKITYHTSTSDANYYGVSIHSEDVTIKDCEIDGTNQKNGAGIYSSAVSSDNLRIDNVEIYSSYEGIGLSPAGGGGSGNNITIINADIYDNLRGIWVSSYSSLTNITFSNINITNTTYTGIEIICSDSACNNFTFENIIINYSQGNFGNFFLNGVYNSSFINITSKNATKYGIWVRDSFYNTFEDIFLLDNVDGIFFSYLSDHNIFKDGDISGTTNYDTLLTDGSNNNTFLNVTYTSESVDGTSELIRKWYFDAQINYSNGTAIEDATVTGWNVTVDQIFTDNTDATGKITQQKLIEYTNLGGTRNFQNNYTINTTKSETITDSTSYNLTLEQNVFHIVSLNQIYGNLLSQEIDLTPDIKRTTDIKRKPSQILDFSVITDPIASFFRSFTQPFSIDSLVSKFKSILVSVSQQINILQPLDITYDFSGVFNSRAFNNTVVNSPPLTLTPVGETEMNYTQINASDDIYATDTFTIDHPYHRFEMAIEEINPNYIDVLWEGHTSSTGTTYLYVWNYTLSDWSLLDSGTGITDFNLTARINYLNDVRQGAGNITFLVQDG